MAEAVQEYVRVVSEMQDRMGHSDWTLARMVRRFGTTFSLPASGKPRPKGVRKMRDRMCYMNAVNLALARSRDGWKYCEGFAVPTGLFPIEHAWVLDGNGVVVEPTWGKLGSEYVGFAVEPLKASLAMGVKGTYGVWPDIPHPEGVRLAVRTLLGREQELVA